MSTLDEIRSAFTAGEEHLDAAVIAIASGNNSLQESVSMFFALEELAESMTATLDAIGHEILVAQANNVVDKVGDVLATLATARTAIEELPDLTTILNDLKMAISQAGA